jgi:hypothetical protein
LRKKKNVNLNNESHLYSDPWCSLLACVFSNDLVYNTVSFKPFQTIVAPDTSRLPHVRSYPYAPVQVFFAYVYQLLMKSVTEQKKIEIIPMNLRTTDQLIEFCLEKYGQLVEITHFYFNISLYCRIMKNKKKKCFMT